LPHRQSHMVRNPDAAYQKALDRLLRDLRVEQG
jgi:hypothetical protein